MEVEKKYKDNYQENFYDCLDRVINRAMREMPERGRFPSIVEEFPNVDENLPAIDRYRLEVLTMPERDVPDTDQRYVRATVYPRGGYYKCHTLVAAGHRDELLKKMTVNDFSTRVNNAYIRLVDMILNPD